MTTDLYIQSAMSHFHTTCLTYKLVCKLILYRHSLLDTTGVCRNFHSSHSESYIQYLVWIAMKLRTGTGSFYMDIP